jgi:hypothetical protein
LLK